MLKIRTHPYQAKAPYFVNIGMPKSNVTSNINAEILTNTLRIFLFWLAKMRSSESYPSVNCSYFRIHSLSNAMLFLLSSCRVWHFEKNSSISAVVHANDFIFLANASTDGCVKCSSPQTLFVEIKWIGSSDKGISDSFFFEGLGWVP